jgi:hypothetical protein
MAPILVLLLTVVLLAVVLLVWGGQRQSSCEPPPQLSVAAPRGLSMSDVENEMGVLQRKLAA